MGVIQWLPKLMCPDTCKSAIELASTIMSAKQLAKFQQALRKAYLTSEIERVQQLMARKVQPVQEYRTLTAQLPVLQQQLASIQ